MARQKTQERVKLGVASDASDDSNLEFQIGGVSDEEEDLVGQTIDDRYEVFELVGSGAMGRVYRAEHIQIRRPVAIKTIYPSLASVPEFARRFKREAIAIGRLDHPNCVAIWDTGRLPTGSLYLAMQYLPGPPLDELLEAGPLSERRALHIARHVASGLAHAHKAGIIHRDIKPSNVIVVDYEGDPDFAEILDFGVAKLAHTLEDVDASQLTRMGQRFGTPSYMSPEQAVGKEVDPRTDLYSLTVMLYEMLTGRRPFESEDAIEMLGMHANKAPPRLSAVGSRSFSEPLEALVAKGLAKRPEDRFHTAAEMIDAIDEVLGRARTETVAPPSPPWWQNRWVIGAWSAVVAIGLIALIVLLQSGDDPAEHARQLLREGKPEEAVEYLEDHSADISENAPAQLVLGHGHAAGRNYQAALAAYRRAVKLDRLAKDDTKMRGNLAIMLDDDDVDVAIEAARLLIDELDDEKARTRAIEHASEHPSIEHRARMRELCEEMGLGDRIDRVTSVELDLRQAPECEDRLRAVAKLRALGDKRSIDALYKAKRRKGNDCLAQAADDAARYLETLP